MPFIDCSRCFKNALFAMPLLLIFSQCFRNSVATLISNICQIQFNLVYSHINFIKVFRYEFTLHLEKGKEYKFNKAKKKCVANQKVLTNDSKINFRGL